MFTWLYKLCCRLEDFWSARNDMYVSERHLDEILRDKGKQ